jgi:hypothetical protein
MSLLRRWRRRLLRFLLTALVVLVAAGAGLYQVSDTFRAWVHHPRQMWRCKIDRGLPDGICVASVKARSLVDELTR